MDADFHNGWTPVRARRWCPFIAARHLVRARRSTQLAEVHSSDKQWNEVLEIPLIEDEEEEDGEEWTCICTYYYVTYKVMHFGKSLVK